jgi:hypothetical protein
MLDRVRVDVLDTADATTDSYGEPADSDGEESWEPVDGWEDVECSIQPASSHRLEEAARLGSRVTHTVYFLGRLAITRVHRLTDLRREGRTFRVEGPIRDVAGQGEITEVDVVEVLD